MPLKLTGSTMVPSPTNKGVVVIGGLLPIADRTIKMSDGLYELSGDSIQTLRWTILEQRLRNGRSGHVSFPIPNQIANDLKNYYADDHDHPLMPKQKYRKTITN